jgi:hypothetical protein
VLSSWTARARSHGTCRNADLDLDLTVVAHLQQAWLLGRLIRFTAADEHPSKNISITRA